MTRIIQSKAIVIVWLTSALLTSLCVPSKSATAASEAPPNMAWKSVSLPAGPSARSLPQRFPRDGSGCPTGWTCGDIGSVGTAGTESFTGTSGTVSGSNGVSAPGDAIHFDRQSFGAASALTVSAHVASVTGTGPALWAGVMVRNGSAPNAFFYFVRVSHDGAVQVVYRNVAGAVDGAIIPGTSAQYVQIRRSGFLFTAYVSSSGASGSWTALSGSTVGIDMTNMDAGLAVESGDGTLATGTFDGVAVSAPPSDSVSSCPAPWTCQDVGIGPNDLAGSQDSVDASTWVLDGAGAGFYYNPPYDGFHYVYQQFGPGAVITAHITYDRADLSNGGLGEAGIMFRETIGSASKDYGVMERSGTGVVVQTRTCGDPNHCGLGTPLNCYTNYRGVPEWLRVKWLGGANFIGYESDDGVTWTQFTCPQADISNTAPWQTVITGGLVTTYGDGSMNVAAFDNVQTVGALTPGEAEYLSLSEHSTSCQCADPVNTGNGMYSDSFGDLSIAGRGVPLDFSRTYRSDNAAQDSPLGFGWTDSYNMFLTLDSLGDVAVHEETGSTVTFVSGGTNYVAPLRVFATLVANVDGASTLTFTRKDHTRYVFSAPTQSAPGQLLKEIDPNGYTTTLTYAGGQLSQVQDASGHTLALAYTDTRPANLNHITSVTDSAGRTVSFGYDATGNLTDAYDVGRADTGIGHARFTYDASHRLLTVTDPRGHVVTNVYDTSGRVTSQTRTMAAGNRRTTFAYATNADGTQTTTITDPNGGVTLHTYRNNELIGITRGYNTPQAATWSYAYDPSTAGITSVTDPNGHQWTYQWDSYGNLTQAVGPASAASATNHETTSIQYTPANSLFYTSAAVTDPSNITTTYRFDGSGNLLSVSRPLTGSSQTATTTLTYGDASHPGDVTAVTDPNNHISRFTYDANGDLLSAADGAGDRTTYTYDSLGRVVSVVSPNGNAPSGTRQIPQSWKYTSTATYDNAGDVTSVTDPLGNRTVYHYDANGSVTSAIDPLQHTTAYTYDEADEPTVVSNPDGTSQGYSYDGDGNVVSQTMLSSTGTTLRTLGYTYDPLGRVATAVDPNNRVTTYGYDGAGNVISRLDPMNRTTNYGYDELNELTSVAYHDVGTHDLAFTYTSLSQRATMGDGTGTSTYTYDSLGRLTKAVNGAGQEVDYGYDLAGNLTGLVYPASPSPLLVTRTFDAANRLTNVVDWLSNVTHFTYDADGNTVKEAFPASTNGATVSTSYDATDAATSIVASRTSGQNPFRWTFGYGRDALGQVAATTDRSPGMRHTYTYDLLNRLTKDQRSNQTATSYTYDGADNLKTLQDTAAGTNKTFSYDTNNDQLTGLQTSGSVSQNLGFSYNADGDRAGTTDLNSNTTVNTYGYNQENQLTSFSQGSTSASYSYDGDGLRVSKTVNGVSESYLWNVVGGMPTILQDGSTRYITGPDGLPIEQIDGSGNVEYYVQDQLGSTRGVLDSAGNVAGTYTFDAYGSPKGHSGVSTPFQYAGQYTDTESGLQYLRARYYDPGTGQFLTIDPAVASTGAPYGYARGDPVNHADPSGLCIFGLPCPDVVRLPLIWAFSAARDWVGGKYGDLTSGNPLCVALAAGSIYLDVFTLGDTAGLAGAERAAAGEFDLYHGTDINSAQSIVEGGLNPAAADRYGGDGKFYTTTDLETARQFARSNPAGGEPAIVGIKLSTGLGGALEQGIVAPMEGFPGTYTASDWEAFNAIANFKIVAPRIP